MLDGRRLMTSFHSKTRRKLLKKSQFKELYRKLQFKKVIKKYQNVPQKSHKGSRKNKKGNKTPTDKPRKLNKENIEAIDVLIEPLEIPPKYSTNQSISSIAQLKTEISYFGCEKNTKSCVGQVDNDKPFYLYIGHHLPPCCLEKLKAVFQYVIEELENTGVRYWLDNAALLNAIELNDLSKDAYEIDISFVFSDYNRSTALRRSDTRPFTDLAGFYWVKATDGQYFKVQYSKTNDIHVNLLPFEIQDGFMVAKNFYGPKSNKFSVEYLHPMSNIFFLGKSVFAPNNAHIYLTSKWKSPQQ